MAITCLFNSTHMVWTLLLEIMAQLCSPYSPATTSLLAWPLPKTIRFSVRDQLDPQKSGLSPSHPTRRYPFEVLPENHVLP